MFIGRRELLKGAALAAASVVGPWSLAGRQARAAAGGLPALEFLTESEYRYINKMSPEVIPDEPVVTGAVDVALNIDRFYSRQNGNPDFVVLLRFLRLIRMADGVLPLIKRISPLTAEDIESFKKTICFLGYYSDANGEADLDPAQRIVWPRIGFEGPKPADWLPDAAEYHIDPAILEDRLEQGR